MEEKAYVSLNNFKKIFDDVKNNTYKIENRNYTGAVGNYFEELLGVKRNNKNRPDFQGWEVKTKTKGKAWFAYFPKDICALTCSLSQKGAGKELLKKYGYEDADGDYCLRTELGFNLNDCGLKIVSNMSNNSIEIHDKKGKTGFYWDNDKIMKGFNSKYENGLILVEADRADYDHFIFTNAKAYYNFDSEKFLNLVLEGKIRIKICIDYYKSGKLKGKMHDHGMQFVINEALLPMLFSDIHVV